MTFFEARRLQASKKALSPSIPSESGRFSLFTVTLPETLGKVFKLGIGAIEKITAGQFIEGRVEVVGFHDVHELVALLSKVETSQAISTSLPRNDLLSARIVTKSSIAKVPTALTRTKEDFLFPPGQRGIIALDYDPPNDEAALSQKQLWELLCKICPAVATAGVAWWCSGSSCIYHNDEEVYGVRGQRLYIMVDDIGDTARFGKVLDKRFWESGHGRIVVSGSGQKLMRSVFDIAMFQPARLDFVGGAVCSPPLTQRRGTPKVLADGSWLDTRLALPDLTSNEEVRVQSLQDIAKTAAEPKCIEARDKWKADRISTQVERLVKSGVPRKHAPAQAERTLASALDGVLLGNFILKLADGRQPTVSQVLQDPKTWHDALTLDPLEPDYHNSKVVGKLYLYGTTPNLYSYAHGGRTYRLCRQPARVPVYRGHKAELVDKLKELLKDEPDIFVHCGQLVQIIDCRIRPLSPHGLVYLIGHRYVLYSKNKDGGECAADLPIDVASMLLSQT